MNQIKGLHHGGDYNPDQWLDQYPDIIDKDFALMKEAVVALYLCHSIYSDFNYSKKGGSRIFNEGQCIGKDAEVRGSNYFLTICRRMS